MMFVGHLQQHGQMKGTEAACVKSICNRKSERGGGKNHHRY
jgi:hypothetical protein